MATPLSDAVPLSHALDISRERTEMRPVEGVDSISQTIREVWARILGMDVRQIGDNLDFVRLGGSSLHAIKVVSAMRAQGLVASTAQILSNATIRELANCYLSEAQSRARVSADGNEDPSPFSLL